MPRYLKFPNSEELHVWMPMLAERGDMIEITVPDSDETIGLGLVDAPKRQPKTQKVQTEEG